MDIVSLYSVSVERSFDHLARMALVLDCLSDPCSVAVDSEGNILVADKDNHRIQKFTKTGEFLMVVGTEGSGPLQFDMPSDVTFNATNNKMYVVDTFNYRVQVLNSDLTFFNTFGKKGSGEGQFKFPWSIACDSTGKMYVTDSSNHRIQVFTAGGKFLRMFGRYGEGRKGLASSFTRFPMLLFIVSTSP